MLYDIIIIFLCVTQSCVDVTGDIVLSSNGGNILFDKLNAQNAIHFNAKNGDITGSILGSYDDFAISCNIKKGESNSPANKKNGAKTLAASNNNGNIDIEFIQK